MIGVKLRFTNFINLFSNNPKNEILICLQYDISGFHVDKEKLFGHYFIRKRMFIITISANTTVSTTEHQQRKQNFIIHGIGCPK